MHTQENPLALSRTEIAAMKNAALTTQHFLNEELAKQTEKTRGLDTILRVRPFNKKQTLPIRVARTD